MKYTPIFVFIFLLSMIAVSIFFSASPFSIVQNYACKDILTSNNVTAKLCGVQERQDQLAEVEGIISQAKIDQGNYTANTLSIISDGITCQFNNEIKCMGSNITNGKIDGNKYIVKQIYGNKTGLCTQEQSITFYFTDCSSKNGYICKEGYCVKHNYQLSFYKFMGRLGFKQ